MKKGTALKDIFNDFLKNELKDIAKQKKIRGYSTLNKEQLKKKLLQLKVESLTMLYMKNYMQPVI